MLPAHTGEGVDGARAQRAPRLVMHGGFHTAAGFPTNAAAPNAAAFPSTAYPRAAGPSPAAAPRTVAPPTDYADAPTAHAPTAYDYAPTVAPPIAAAYASTALAPNAILPTATRNSLTRATARALWAPYRADSSESESDSDDSNSDDPMGTPAPPVRPQPLSPPPELRIGGKRRRLNGPGDCDSRELAELMELDEDEAPGPNPAPRPSTASAIQGPVLSVYVHDAPRFTCALCTYTAASFASLKRHRDSRHRRAAFQDKFSAGCACGTPFDSRLAAARHAQACASLSRPTSATAPPAAGASNPTASVANATAAAAILATDLPLQVPLELAASPPPASSPDEVPQAAPKTQRPSRWSPALPRMMVASRVAERLGATPPPLRGPPLPHAARIAATPTPRWGPPLPRSVVTARIAARPLPSPVDLSFLNEETKESEPPDETMPTATAPASTAPASTAPREWRLQFDGACRHGPAPGGAGAILFDPDGAAAWTGSSYMPGTKETNNTAEYTALLLGARAAADHGASPLRIEGDSLLVIRQVKGLYGTKSTRLRRLRNAVRQELARVGSHTLHHIDRQANGFADRLANCALDQRSNKVECKQHSAPGRCPTSADPSHAPASPSTAPEPAPPVGDRDVPMSATDDEDDDSADIDDGEVYAPIRLEPGIIPARRPRLRIRKLGEEEDEAARVKVARLAAALAAKITDASDWETVEGYITALPYNLYDALQPYAQDQRQQQRASRPPRPPQPPVEPQQASTAGEQRGAGGRRRRRRSGRSGAAKKQRRGRPPRVTRHHREHRLDEALDDLHAVERATPSDRPAIRKARRRVGRVNSAIATQRLRHRFDTDEKACVEAVLASARAERATATAPAGTSAPRPTEAPDESVCPIPGAQLWEFFTGVNTPGAPFDPMAPEGAPFREALARLPAATADTELLTDPPTADDIEDQLQRVRPASSPGQDGVGYDVYKTYATELLPALHAAFASCWRYKRVPQSWKLGAVRLIYKKGPREDPANWRPICLQQAVYKLYAGVLARRFTRWLDSNQRHAEAQKGFRAVNGCGEHNFLAATLVDQARRKKRELHVVWYDLKNAFGSVPHDLLWSTLQRMGVPAAFIDCCRGLYQQAAFSVGNACDGTTAPIASQVGVFQGCPLSPHLFTAVISPLLHALHHLVDAGVKLSADDRPGASAYADDLKIFSGTVDGAKKQHAIVADFLRWTGMVANPTKCATMSIQRDQRGVLQAYDLGLQLDGAPIPSLTMSSSYAYLGIGDGFDHVRRRVELAPTLKTLKEDATALLRSGLAPWQVVKAVKVYLYPRVEYALRHLRPFQQQLEGFDRHLVRGLRHLLRLPTSSTTAFFYAPESRGGLGLLPLVEVHAALQVAHGWQVLHSKDPAIRRIAREQLRQIAETRHRLDLAAWTGREDELCELLLNAQLGAAHDAPPKRRNGDIGSLWVDVRRHLSAYGLKLETAPASAEAGTPAAPLQLRVPHHSGWLDHRTVLRHVKLHMKHKHWTRWAAMKDQGKTARTHGGVGSGFLTRPRGLWEPDYRFAVAARLNQLDTHSVLKRRRLRAHDACRHPGCSRSETLAHVLNHCPGTMDAVRGRHDDALKSIERAISASSRDCTDRVELRVNQTVPELGGPALRPDIQLFNHTTKTVAVVDLAVAFEEQAADDEASSALARTAAHKRAKYAGVQRHLERQGWTVHLSALVYGSLGAVAGGNHKVYTEHLGLLKRDAKRLDRQLSASCIQSSRRIWNLHCSQHRARQQRQGTRGSRAAETGGTPPHNGGR